MARIPYQSSDDFDAVSPIMAPLYDDTVHATPSPAVAQVSMVPRQLGPTVGGRDLLPEPDGSHVVIVAPAVVGSGDAAHPIEPGTIIEQPASVPWTGQDHG